MFTRKIAPRHRPNVEIRIENEYVQWQNNIKYLGVTLDKRLTFKNHIEQTVMKSDIHSLTKLNNENKILLFKTIFRQSITNACPVWITCAKTHLTRLQRAQNKILKIMLDLHWKTSTTSVHELSNVDLILDHIRKLNEKFS